VRIAIVGDLAVDMVAYDRWMLDAGSSLILKNVGLLPGGVAGNMAWVLNQLSIEPVIFSAVGKDCWGEFVREGLRRGGLKTNHITLHDEPTGFFIIVVSPDGQRTMVGTRGANAKLRITTRVLRRVRPDWVHVSGYSLLGEQGLPLFEEAKSASRILGAHLSIDLEGVSGTDIRPALRGAEVLCNQKEFEDYFQSEMREVAASRRGPIVVKAGAEGCYLLFGGRVRHIPTGKVKVRDTTGAGDAFNAGFVATRMRGQGLVAACNAGNFLGSEKVQHEGAKLTLRAPAEKPRGI
jgi:ribokinase